MYEKLSSTFSNFSTEWQFFSSIFIEQKLYIKIKYNLHLKRHYFYSVLHPKGLEKSEFFVHETTGNSAIVYKV